jgi:membrane protein
MAALARKRSLRVPKLDLSGFFALVVEAGKAWSIHRVPRMGAALSYYTAFSLAPLVVFVLSAASLVMKKKQASNYIVQEVTDLMGPKGGAAVQEIVDHAASTHAASWGTVISFIVLLIGASGAFGELQDSLNQIWDVPPQKNAFLSMIKERALSFAMVFVLGFFMLVSLVFSAMIEALSKLVVYRFPAAGLELTNTLISFVAFFGLFCIIFRMLPDVPLKWSDVWPGAIFSSALFIIGKFLLGWYIGFSSTSFSRYGAAGSFIIILVWVFYSAQILFMGAEFSRAYTLKYGSHRNLKKQGEPVMGDEVVPRS